MILYMKTEGCIAHKIFRHCDQHALSRRLNITNYVRGDQLGLELTFIKWFTLNLLILCLGTEFVCLCTENLLH